VPAIHRVTSLDLPELQTYRTLRRSQEHLERGVFVAEGEKVVRRLLASGLPIVSLLLTDEWLGQLTSTGFSSFPCDVFTADKGLLESIVGFRMHQGIMAVGHVPTEPTLDDLVRSSPSPRCFVALDGLVSSENVGVVVRNCAAFGVQGILVGETSASPYLRRAVRNSMGTVFQIPIIHTPKLSEALMSLRSENNMSVIVADAHATDSVYDIDCQTDVCIVLGNEGTGVSSSTRMLATASMRIPMKEGVDSLNVASASAVILSKVSRQRAF